MSCLPKVFGGRQDELAISEPLRQPRQVPQAADAQPRRGSSPAQRSAPAGTPKAIAYHFQPSGLSSKCCSRTPNSEGSRATQEASKSPTSIKSRRWVRSLSRNEVSFMRANALRERRRNDSVASDSVVSGAGSK